MTIPRQEQSIGTLTHYDLVGFQTENDKNNYGRYLTMIGATVSRDGSAYALDGRVTRIGAFPVSIETRDYAKIAQVAEQSNFTREVRDSLAGRPAPRRGRQARLFEGHHPPHRRLFAFPRHRDGVAQPRRDAGRSRPRAGRTSPNTATWCAPSTS